jgi:hypothetical protein
LLNQTRAIDARMQFEDERRRPTRQRRAIAITRSSAVRFHRDQHGLLFKSAKMDFRKRVAANRLPHR